MRRFNSNRWWILILALVLSVAGVAFLPSAGLADKGSDGTIGNDSGGTNPPEPGGIGDPDSPSGSGKANLQGGGGTFYGTTSTSGAGDARRMRAERILMQVRITLGMLKYYSLKF